MLHSCLKTSRTKRPMQHHVAPHHRCRFVRTCLARNAPCNTISHLTAAGCKFNVQDYLKLSAHRNPLEVGVSGVPTRTRTRRPALRLAAFSAAVIQWALQQPAHTHTRAHIHTHTFCPRARRRRR